MGEFVEVDSKGRVVIPSSIRNRFGLESGMTLFVSVREDSIVLTKAEFDTLILKSESEENEEVKGLKEFLRS